MGIRIRGVFAGAVDSVFMFSTISISSPIMPNALRRAGHSSHSVGIPARAGESRRTLVRCALVSAWMSADSGHSHKMCSAVSSFSKAQSGHVLEKSSPWGFCYSCRVESYLRPNGAGHDDL
jgi:hypothetical protein